MSSVTKLSILIGTDNLAQINYLMKAKTGKMNLIDGNPKIFSDVLSLIDEYAGRSWVPY
jgi:hypothetical protein